jgi:hypothetical protein
VCRLYRDREEALPPSLPPSLPPFLSMSMMLESLKAKKMTRHGGRVGEKMPTV